MEFIELLSVFVFLLVILSPFILFYGLLNMKYELLDDRLVMKFYGTKFREILYEKIKNIKSFEQFPFIKSQKWKKIAFNQAICLELDNKKYFFTKKTIITPQNRDEFFNELEKKINKNL